MKIQRPLKANELEVKVKQVTKNGCLLLLYKTARVDMQVLDETFGYDKWCCDYKIINDVLYCGIGVFLNNQWVWKWDCGIESRGDGEGNEKKGQASDAFKRAAVKWGVGRELYSAPFIWVKVPVTQSGDKYYLANKYEQFTVKSIQHDSQGEIISLKIQDSNCKVVYSWESNEISIREILTKCKDIDELKKCSRQLFDEKPHLKDEIIDTYNELADNMLRKQKEVTK